MHHDTDESAPRYSEVTQRKPTSYSAPNPKPRLPRLNCFGSLLAVRLHPLLRCCPRAPLVRIVNVFEAFRLATGQTSPHCLAGGLVLDARAVPLAATLGAAFGAAAGAPALLGAFEAELALLWGRSRSAFAFAFPRVAFGTALALAADFDFASAFAFERAGKSPSNWSATLGARGTMATEAPSPPSTLLGTIAKLLAAPASPSGDGGSKPIWGSMASPTGST